MATLDPEIARPASPPRHEVATDWDVRITRARRRGAVGQHLASAARSRRPRGCPLPGDPRDDPVWQGQLAAQCGRGPRRVLRPPGLRAVPARRPRHRQLRRHRARRIQRGRDARRVRRGRVARGPGVVRRQRRDVGHQLRRVHLDPGREASPAAPARDRPGHGHRRPLYDRRALRRRVRDRERAQPVRREPGRDERDATRRRVPRRGLARRMAGPARGDAAVAVRMAAPAARRPVLAAGLPRPRLRGDRRPDPEHRRLDGLVCRCGAADAGAVHARPPGRSSATGSTSCRRREHPVRTSTSSTRWSASSIAGCGAAARALARKRRPIRP